MNLTTIAQVNEFERALDEWVCAAFAHGVGSFPELIRSLPSVYPTDALRAVVRLRGELPSGWQVDGSHFTALPSHDNWPVEHPLDFDWRFTPETTQKLVDRCPKSAADSVTILGAPSVFQEAAMRGLQGSVVLFDRNPVLIAAVRNTSPQFKAVCADLVWGVQVRPGDAVVTIADPPWYPDDVVAFLWAASRLTQIGGQVFLSLPPVGTRPGILPEREAIVASAATFGLELASVEPEALTYLTPPFERNALVAAGVPAVPCDWRRGDLAIFIATEKTSSPHPVPTGLHDKWDEVSVGVVRIKCRACTEVDFFDPTLSNLVRGDMLKSVSRRDPARMAAEVWTSGNRVFACAGSGVLRMIVSALARGDDVKGAVIAGVGRELTGRETDLIRLAAEQVADLIRREEKELHAYGYRRSKRQLAEAI